MVMWSKILILLLFVFTLGFPLQAQNLIPNPSFEEYTVCPDDYSILPMNWFSCSATPDYFNSCDLTNSFSVPYNGFGNQDAFNGRGYCGFFGISFTSWPYAKEYLGCQLLTPLQIGHKYFVSFKVSRAEWHQIAINNIGLLFSTQSNQDYQPIDNLWNIPTVNFAHVLDTNIITDTINWTDIKGSIIADSAYQFISIGNFFDSLHTNTIIYNHDNFFQQRAYYYVDMVCVSEDSLSCNSTVSINENLINKPTISVYPNPIKNKVIIKNNVVLFNETEICIYNITGLQMISDKVKNQNSVEIDVSKLARGVYILTIKNESKIEFSKLIID